MIFLKWLHRRQDEELLKTAEQVLKDFRNEISSMAVCGEEREVLENMIFLLLNTYMEEDEKSFSVTQTGRAALIHWRRRWYWEKTEEPMPLLMTGVWKRSRGSTKHLPGILEKISPLSGLMYLQEWCFCTQERQEIERKGHSACWTLPTGCWGIGSLSIILFVRFLYGSVWTRGCIFRGVVKSSVQADFGLAAWV